MVNVGSPGIKINPPPDPLRPLVKQVVSFQQAANINAEWDRFAENDLGLTDDVSDVYPLSKSESLGITDVAIISTERHRIIAENLTIAQEVSVAGGRIGVVEGQTIPQVEYQEDSPKGTPLYSSGTGQASIAQATLVETSIVIGLSSQDYLPGDLGFIVNAGWLSLDDWSAITGSNFLEGGKQYFLDTQKGKLTQISPVSEGEFSVVIGIAVDNKTLFISIEPPILL